MISTLQIFHLVVQKLTCFRGTLEKDAQPREAKVLRRAGTTVQNAHGEVSRLPVPAKAQAHMHCRWQETPHLRVQNSHEKETRRQ